jgi:hypothetical protein
MIQELCSVIRETGVSDSGAAARVSLHPSTVSRWKKEFPDLAILLRSAREDFRTVQLELIMEAARAGHATSWRAAAWLLERIFPQDYAPRAKERTQFQERFDAVCAAEEEGGAIALPTQAEPLQNVKNSAPLAAGEADFVSVSGAELQNVKNPAPLPAPPEAQPQTAGRAPASEREPTLPPTTPQHGGAKEARLPETPLQNVKNPPLARPL